MSNISVKINLRQLKSAIRTMKEHPILFSTTMVQAILGGRKTQTRRIVKPQPDFAQDKPHCFTEFMQAMSPPKSEEINCPYGQPGDRLWVRETFAYTINDHEPYDTISYKADNFHRDVNRPGFEFTGEDMCGWLVSICQNGWHDADLSECLKWKPSIHMPKSAARIWLEITEVKVERLQDISKEDAKAEGIKYKGITCYDYMTGLYDLFDPRSSFTSLWYKINGPESWHTNPWVWVVKFKVLSTTGMKSPLPPLCKGGRRTSNKQ